MVDKIVKAGPNLLFPCMTELPIFALGQISLCWFHQSMLQTTYILLTLNTRFSYYNIKNLNI